MLTVDPLTNLDARGFDTHRTTRERVVVAFLSPGDAWTRQEAARRTWVTGDTTLRRLRDQAVQAAATTAQGLRRDLFDMTRAAAHASGDSLARGVAREAAQRFAANLKDEGEALEIINVVVRRPRSGDGFNAVKAGAAAERAYDEGWDDAVTAWIGSAVVGARGGTPKLAALRYAERVARGDEVPDGLRDLAPLPKMAERAGHTWVEMA